MVSAEGSNNSKTAEVAKKIKELLIESPDDRVDAARLDELRKVFAQRTPDMHATISSNSTVQMKWKEFLQQKHKVFIKQLCDRIAQGKRTAIRTIWGVVATTPIPNGDHNIVSTDLLLDWIRAMSFLPDVMEDKTIRNMLQAEFLNPYRDVQYYTMIAIARCAHELYGQQTEGKDIAERAERILEILTMMQLPTSQKDLDSQGGLLFVPPEDAVPQDDGNDEAEAIDSNDASEDSSDSDSEDEQPAAKRAKISAAKAIKPMFTFQKVSCHRLAWSKAWLAVLKLDLPLVALKKALRFLPGNVLPHVPHPLRFSDFFMEAYNHNGVVSVLALDGLFLLITAHGLEYPNFYKQLYRLITPSLLYVKYRTRFFRLLDKCLTRNEMLPTHIVAAFVKRLLRSTLVAPVPSVLFVLALCSNLLRKRPEMACLVHRNDDEWKDGFDAETDDPEEANALQSSLWELGALERHYYPAVSTLAKSVGREQELSTPLYNLDDFLAHTYQSLFEQERNKRKQQKGKATVPLTFVRPDSLFSEKDVFHGLLAVPSSHSHKEAN
jgi:U3 small nucleolar RNA-associated protein 19